MKKLNNYGMWIALFALLALVLQDIVPGFDFSRYEEYVNAFLALLIAAGVISNPSVGQWFKDSNTQK